MTTLIVKITDGTDIRRFTANVADLTFESVQKRTAEAFGVEVHEKSTSDRGRMSLNMGRLSPDGFEVVRGP